jgi:hypothetical protein
MNLSNTSAENLRNLQQFWDWMESTGRVEIVYFEAPSKLLLSLMDKDAIDYFNTCTMSGLSYIIDLYSGVSDETKDFFVNESCHEDWYPWVSEDNYHCYQLVKVAWLLRDIRKNGQQAPIHFMKSVECYQCHPGSDKKYAMMLLDPLQTIKCFYTWYPEIDPNPWHKNYPHRKITNIDEFVSIFEKAGDPTFVFEYGDVHFTKEGYKTSTHFEPFARFSSEILLKRAKREQREFEPFSVKHISYRDSVHRLKMEKEKHLLNNIYFESDEIFWLDGIKFNLKHIKGNRLWMPEMYDNSPKSLFDTEWKYDPKFNMTFSLEYPGT